MAKIEVAKPAGGGENKLSLGALLQALTVIETEARQARVDMCLALELREEAKRPTVVRAPSGLHLVDAPQMAGDLVSDQAAKAGAVMSIGDRSDQHVRNTCAKCIALAVAIGLLTPQPNGDLRPA